MTVVAVEDEFGIELGEGADGMPDTLGGIVDLIRCAMGEYGSGEMRQRILIN